MGENEKKYTKREIADAIIELVEYIKSYRLSAVYGSNMSDKSKDIIMNHIEDLEWLFEGIND